MSCSIPQEVPEAACQHLACSPLHRTLCVVNLLFPSPGTWHTGSLFPRPFVIQQQAAGAAWDLRIHSRDSTGHICFVSPLRTVCVHAAFPCQAGKFAMGKHLCAAGCELCSALQAASAFFFPLMPTISLLKTREHEALQSSCKRVSHPADPLPAWDI